MVDENDDEMLPLADALINVRRSLERANAVREAEGKTAMFLATDVEVELLLVAEKAKSKSGGGGVNFSVMGIGFKGEGKGDRSDRASNTHRMKVKLSPILKAEDGSQKLILDNKIVDGGEMHGPTVHIDDAGPSQQVETRLPGGMVDEDSLPGGGTNY